MVLVILNGGSFYRFGQKLPLISLSPVHVDNGGNGPLPQGTTRSAGTRPPFGES